MEEETLKKRYTEIRMYFEVLWMLVKVQNYSDFRVGVPTATNRKPIQRCIVLRGPDPLYRNQTGFRERGRICLLRWYCHQDIEQGHGRARQQAA